MFERIKELCDSFLDMGVPGFDLMICRDGGGILRYKNGHSDLEKKILAKEVQNKAIQKICESLRTSKEEKDILRTLKIIEK